jgi:Spy/CpxP family protein refolding chaperone
MRKLFVLASIVMLFSFSAFSQNKDNVKNLTPNMNVEKFKESLGLNDNQVEKIKTIMKDATEEINKQKIEIQRCNLDLKEELIKDKPDMNKVKSTVEKKFSVQAESEMILIKRDLDIKAVLTPEQLSNWIKLVNSKNDKSDKKMKKTRNNNK